MLGVAGFPVAHSRSPAMHNAALAELGLDWLYVPVPVPPERFEETVRALPGSGFRGLNVTVPHKLAAHRLADVHTPDAAAIGAVNTLTFAEDAIEGHNTDAAGFLDALATPVSGQKALVLGAGGSARDVVWALREAGAADVAVWNRTPERAAALAGEFGIRHVDRAGRADLLVNCTSVGLDPATTETQALEALGLTGYEAPPTLVDLVYGDRPTPLAGWASRADARVIEGLEVLVRQGARSLEGWTGQTPPLDTMRGAAKAR